MLVSLKNVNQYVSLEGLTAEEIANKLTFAGIEVEEVYTLAQGTNLIIGEVVECVAHPDSDHLHVLKVNLGEKYGVEQIVCGAPNARAGIKVIVAMPGAKLPGGEIKRGVIRGQESNGMCCSLLELGIESKYLTEYQTSGIEELPADAPVGCEDVFGFLGLDDTVLNLKVLANRPDLLSLFNVAKEIAALFEREVKIPSVNKYNDFKTNLKVGSATEKCTQFSSREVKEIVTKPSPRWMSSYLMAMGVRSINNIVDIGNYVMLMTGQPLHMYDADKLAKAELIARDDYSGDLVALDEKAYKIIPGDIVITSDGVPQCLGGIMGSLSCAVDENTKNIYIESASFDGASIRHTSNRLGLGSESSSRFVKGTNHFQSEYVLDYTTDLLKDLCEAKECSDIVTYLNEEKPVKIIKSSLARINGRLGTEFTMEQVKNVLSRVYFDVDVASDNTFTAKVPDHRLDVTCDADLSEEVIRILGFDNVKSILPNLDMKVGALTLEQQRIKNIRDYLLGAGVDECLTYSLVSKKEMDAFNLLNNEEHYSIINPLTDDKEVFRTHILHSLLKSASYNIAHQNKDLMLFETSNMISKSSASEHLAIVLVGNEYVQGHMSPVAFDFYSMKGLVEGIFQTLGIENSRYKFERPTTNLDKLHPGKSANIIFQNQVVGTFGELHPNMYGAYDLGKTSCVVLEMNLESLLTAKVSVTKMAQFSKFPSITRDLALVVDKAVEVKDLIKTIKVEGKGVVVDAYVFDVYEGVHIVAGKKSVAISIVYQKSDSTLKDAEVNEVENKIKFALNKAYKAEIRM
ncbi:MAG: phenylalanine--tRNA ligase subunit beta [Bacilli bacterium]|nr:phenylalanine--tRNA ligase subunit beta [Bacilli bacterium]